MNYKLIYEHLVKRGQERTIIDSYKEQHHIIPRCMGGGDSEDNLVDLTPEEHYVAHQLLVKIHPNNLHLVRACDIMSKDTKASKYWRKNKMYGWLRRRLYVPRIDTICKQCGITFKSLECMNRSFCSTQCKVDNQKKPTVLKCKGCSQAFEVKQSMAKYRTYCSPACSRKYRYINDGTSISWICPKCNSTIFINKCLSNTKKYCTRKCRYST